jgi:flagellin-like protein
MKELEMKSRKAISPVIATVILVAVAITIAVAVSYWMSGISSQYTKFEKVEIQSAYAVKVAAGWNVTLQVKNTGSAVSTLSSVFINDRPLNSTGYKTTVLPTIAAGIRVITSVPTTGLVIAQGESKTVTILISDVTTPTYTKYSTFTSGTTVNIKLHSAGGMDYIKLIELV